MLEKNLWALKVGMVGLCLTLWGNSTAYANASLENNARALLAIQCFNGSLDYRQVQGFETATFRAHGYVHGLKGSTKYECIVYPKKWPYGSPPPEATYNDLWALGGWKNVTPRGYPVLVTVPDGKIMRCDRLEPLSIRNTWFTKPVCALKTP